MAEPGFESMSSDSKQNFVTSFIFYTSGDILAIAIGKNVQCIQNEEIKHDIADSMFIHLENPKAVG
jgi:hypothetical protein